MVGSPGHVDQVGLVAEPEIQDNFFRFWFRYIHRYSSLIEIGDLPALEQIMLNDYTTFSGISLERWFRQKMMESHRYKIIGG